MLGMMLPLSRDISARPYTLLPLVQRSSPSPPPRVRAVPFLSHSLDTKRGRRCRDTYPWSGDGVKCDNKNVPDTYVCPVGCIRLLGYLGYKTTLARGSVGLRFLKIRKPSENPVGPISLGLRKRTKAVGPRFLKS